MSADKQLLANVQRGRGGISMAVDAQMGPDTAPSSLISSDLFEQEASTGPLHHQLHLGHALIYSKEYPL